MLYVQCKVTFVILLVFQLFTLVIQTKSPKQDQQCWAVKKKDENKLNSAEMRMLRWARGKTRLDHIRNEDIRKEAHVKPRKQKTKVVWPLLETRKQTHLCEIAETRGCWEKEPRSTEKEMEGQR